MVFILLIEKSLCICVPVSLHVCVFVFYLDGVYVGKELRHCNTYGVNIPYESRCHPLTTKPTISAFYRIFVQDLIGHKSEKNSHHYYLSRMLYLLCFGKGIWFFFFFVLPQLKSVLELNTVSYRKGTLESWILAGIERVPPRILKWVV